MSFIRLAVQKAPGDYTSSVVHAACRADAWLNTPCLAVQEKYSLPKRLPSCMPTGWSKATPTHSPVAKPTWPTYCTVPALPFHMTREPTAKEPPAGAGAATAAGAATGAAAIGAAAGAAGVGAPPAPISAGVQKMPVLGGHVKYGTLNTVPSCMPFGASSWTPTHSPDAKSTGPLYFTVPGLPFQVTFWPTVATAARLTFVVRRLLRLPNAKAATPATAPALRAPVADRVCGAEAALSCAAPLSGSGTLGRLAVTWEAVVNAKDSTPRSAMLRGTER
mmetsp:Transcript_3598/g.6029  ORF Transcript_3598/g.6029 Transcript_3598/m.6029 type:complete len:277 (-) Transcript_3598:59-889(-)